MRVFGHRDMRVSSGGPHVFHSCPHERIEQANHERHTSSRCVPRLKQYGMLAARKGVPRDARRTSNARYGIG